MYHDEKRKGGLMNISNKLNFLRSCIWLWVPPLVVSFAFWPNLGASYQPEVFWADIPPLLGIVENVSRFLTIGLSTFMLFEVGSRKQRLGLLIYVVGMALYVASQWAIVVAPQGSWSTSYFGFLAPAYTPVFWIVGIGMIGQKLVFPFAAWRSWMFFSVSGIFLVAHNAHAVLVFGRL
ncbi:MAG: hypothetical protein ACJAZW_000315 [Maritalea sp.]|jgi:hypothetical protein